MKIKDLLEELGVRPSKRRGQNFLIHPDAARSIARFAQVTPEAPVVEVGPGLGVLTRAVLEHTNRLALVEIEPKFCEYLRGELPAIADRIIERDVRLVTGEELASLLGCERFLLASNVPYSISSEMILWCIAQRRFITRACLLLQQEFAERIAAAPGTKSYGSLSVMTRLYANIGLGGKIKGGAFHPPTEVASQLLALDFLPEPRFEVADDVVFERIVRGSFGKRRKTLLNSLSSAHIVEDKATLGALLEQTGIDPKRRAETLSLEEFVRLANAVVSAA